MHPHTLEVLSRAGVGSVFEKTDFGWRVTFVDGGVRLFLSGESIFAACWPVCPPPAPAVVAEPVAEVAADVPVVEVPVEMPEVAVAPEVVAIPEPEAAEESISGHA